MLAQTRRRPRTVLVLEDLENRELLNAAPIPFPTEPTTSSLAVVNNDQVSQSNVPALIVLENSYDTARNALATVLQPWMQSFVHLEFAVFGMAQQEFNILRHDADTLLDDLGIHVLDPSPSSSAADDQEPHDPDFTVHPLYGPTIDDPPINATEGIAWNGIVATVGDGDGSSPSDFQDDTISGTIDWGDGHSMPFSVDVPEGQSANVEGGNTWMEPGAYTVTVTASDGDGGQSQITETADVSDGQLTWMNNPPNGWTQTFEAAPGIYGPGNQSNTEGDTVYLPMQGGDSDGDTLSYDALNLPPGLSINSSTGVISGTVAYGDAEDFDGTYNPTIIVADGKGGSNSTTFTWNISQAQIAPVLTNPINQTNLRGDNVSLQLNTTQVDNDPITYAATNLPTGLSIDSQTGIISGTVDPSVALGTPYAVTVTATDDSTNLSSSQTFNWTINSTNVAPVLTSPGNQSNAAGDQVSLQLSASDADGDALTYTATGLPPGLSLDPISGVLSGTLPNSAARSTPYNVSVMASDGMVSSSQNFTWTVNGISLQNPGDQGNLDGDNVSLQLNAVDTNNGTLSYSATGLPAGLTINSTTGLISGTIANTGDPSSPYAVTVTATDGTYNASQSFNWTVARLALNAPSNQENQEGTAVSLQLSAADHVGTPTYSATGLPPGLSLNSTTGLISGNVGLGSFGSSPYHVTVTATDGTYKSSQSFVWTVTPRVALVNPGDQSNASGDSVSLQLSATSPGGTMTYSASGLPSGLSLNNSTGLISGTLPSSDVSATPYSVTVTANDGTSSSSQTFAWTISAINLVSPGDQTNNDGDTVSLSLTTGYHGSGTLSYSATGLPPGLSINSSMGQISGTIAGTADTNSPYAVTVTATDGTNTSSQSFNWAVNPVVSLDALDDQSNGVGDTVSVPVSASDALNNTLSYSATNLPSGLTINSTTGLISGVIAVGADSSSPYAVTVTATDSAGLSATQSFTWNVAHVSLVNPGPLQSNDGANVSLQLQGSDADGDTLSYTASALPSGLSINANTGLISGTIASNADTNSPYNVTVTASDGTNTTTQTFLWAVGQVSLSTPSDQTNSEGDSVSLQLQGTASSGSLTYNASGLPNGLSLNPTTGLISGTIAAGDAANGPYTVDVAAMNGTVSTSETFTWNVNPVVNLTMPADQNNNEGDTVSLQMSATDALNKTLTYTASGLPSGLNINSSTGLITGTISSGDPQGGPFVVMVTASDGTYSSSATFNWNVTDKTALTLTAPPTQVNVASDSVNMQLQASDPDGDVLTYSATGLPDGLNIDPSSGIISGTIADDAASTTPYQATVTATDGNGQSVSQNFTYLVNAPTITAQGVSISLMEGVDPNSFTVATFTTPDMNSLPDDFSATINWGDGTTDTGAISGGNGSFTVTADHIYAEKGTYPVSIVIDNGLTGGTASTSTTATVADAPLTLTGGFQLGDAFTDPPSNFFLGTFTDANLGASLTDFTASIDWGDGTPVQTSGSYIQETPAGTFLIVAPHTYNIPAPGTSPPQTYTVTVTVTDVDGATATATDTVVTGALVAETPAGMGGWSFYDQNPYASTSDFVSGGQTGAASISWGDGASNVVSLTGGPGNGDNGPVAFAFQGTHTYADSLDQSGGVYNVSVATEDEDGTPLSGMESISVVRPQLSLYVANVDIPSSLTVSNVQVAAFTDPSVGDGSSEFTAQIAWGDGSTSQGTIQEVAPGLFQVLGSHTYATDAWYTMTVTISQGWGGMAAAVEGAGEDGNTPIVKFLNKNSSQVTNLKVATLIDSFTRVNPGTNPPINKLKNNFFDYDPDGFDVEVWDPMAKGQNSVTVHMATSSDPTGHDVALPELGKYPGYFRATHWMILASNTVDTKAGGNQAFLVKLGDTVRATYGKVVTAFAKVPVVNTVNLHIDIAKDQKGAAGTAPITAAQVQSNVDWANKIYAPLGIHFKLEGPIQTVAPPVDLSNGVAESEKLDKNGKLVLTAQETALLGLRTPNTKDIWVYYVKYLSQGGREDTNSGGETFRPGVLSVADQKYANSIIVAAKYKDYRTLAHEFGHILMVGPKPDVHPNADIGTTRVQLMATPKQVSGEVTDSRRITARDAKTILSDKSDLLLPP